VGSGAGKGASWELDSPTEQQRRGWDQGQVKEQVGSWTHLPEQQRRGWDQGQVKEQVGSWTHSLNSRGEGGIRGR
jgi:uncharacterized protein YjbJ (UPF0337 family)